MSKKLRFIKTILSATLTCIAGTFFMVSCNKSTPGSIGVAPTVISVPKDKLVEVGTYTDFDSDMESLLITDDNQEQLPYVTKKPVSIKIGNKTEENASGFTTYCFGEVGEYQITVEVKDTDGNATYVDYKVTAVDTTAPEIILNDYIYAWENNGLITLPNPRIIDNSMVAIDVVVKKDGNEVSVTDGKVAARLGDTLTAVYTAKDGSDNQTTKETVIKVIQPGKLIEVNDVNATKVLTAKDGVIEAADELSYYCNATTDIVEWRDGGYTFEDSKEYGALSVSIKNTKSVGVEIAVYAKINGEKIAVGNIDVAPKNSGTQRYTISLSGIDVKKVEGWRFALKSASNLHFTISDISLTDDPIRENVPEPTDDALINFEDSTAFEFISVRNGGFAQNENANYVSNGTKSAKAILKANDSVGALFKNKVDITSDANYVSLSLFAQKSGAVRIGLVISGVEYSGAEVELNAYDVNKKNFFINVKTIENFQGKTIDGIFVYNQENYSNTIYIDSLSTSYKDSLATEEIFYTPLNEYEVDKTENFVVPNAVICDIALLKGVTVKNAIGEFEIGKYKLGEEVDFSDLESGTYVLTYEATDVFNETHSYEIRLTVKENALTGSVTFSNYYTNEDIILPDPTLSSAIFDGNTLKNAQIDKYYRLENESGWVLLNGALRLSEPAYIDVKYVVTLGEYKFSTFSNIYIHEQGVVMDYEKHIGGDHLGYRGHKYNSAGNKPVVSTAWAKDGKYSLFVQYSAGWDDINGVWETRYRLPGYVDTVVFWAYSQWDQKPATLWFDDYSNQAVEGKVQIKSGVHRYVVKLSKPIDRFDRWWINVDKMHGFYIDSISMYNSADYEYQNIDGNKYDVADGAITFKKPLVGNVNTNIFTAEEISDIKYYLDVTNNETKIKKTYEFIDEELRLALIRGTYVIKYRVIIGETEYYDVQNITVTDIYTSYVKPLTTINVNTEYRFDLPDAADGAIKNAYIGVYGENEWVALPIEENQAIVNVPNSGKYEIKFTVEKGGATDEKIYVLNVRASNVIADFEVDEDGNHNGTYGRDDGTWGYVSNEWSKDGEYSYYFNTGNHALYEFIPTQAVRLDGKYNALAVEAKVVRNPVYGCTNLGTKINGLEITLSTIDDGGISKSFTSKQVLMPVGENKYIFVFDYDFDNITRFSFWVHYIWASSFYLDNITAENVNFPDLEANSNIKVGSTIEILKASSSVDGVVTEVSYGLAGSENYTPVAETDGKYVITFNQNGEYEVITRVKIGGNAFITRITAFAVRNFSVDFKEPISTLNRNREYEWTVYETAATGTTVEVYVKKAAETEWRNLSLNADGKSFKITLTDADDYELKYVAKNGDNSEEAIYSLRSRDPNTLIDFEEEENGKYFGAGTDDTTQLTGSCYVSDAWAADGKYSYFFGYKAISTIGFYYYDVNKFNAAHGWIREGYRDLGDYYNAITLTINAQRILYGYKVALDENGDPIKDANGYNTYVKGDGIKITVGVREADGSLRYIESNAIIIPVGVGTYTFTFEESFKDVYSINFGLHYWMATDFYVDALKVEKVIYPVLPDSVQVNDEITVTAAKFNDNTTTKVKYSVNGGTYINLGTIKESCKIRATDFGKIDIVVEINIEGAIITLRQTVFVISDPATEDIEWN